MIVSFQFSDFLFIFLVHPVAKTHGTASIKCEVWSAYLPSSPVPFYFLPLATCFSDLIYAFERMLVTSVMVDLELPNRC